MDLNRNHQQKKLHEHKRKPLVRLFALVSAIVVSTSIIGWAGALYILSDTDDTAIVLDGSDKTPDVSSKLVYLKSGRAGFDIALHSKQTVTVHQNDTSTVLQAAKFDTISKVLDKAGIVPGPLDMIGVDVSEN